MRQFLALELPPQWKAALERAAGALSEQLRGWRWLSIDSVHLTVRFLGDVDAARDRRARVLWAETVAAHETVDLRLSAIGAFPLRGRPRVLWAGVASSPPLAALAGDLDSAAESLGFDAEGRAFRPHLTLARARRGESPDRPSAAAGRLHAPAFRVETVTLFRSVLQRSGPRYTALEHYRLAAG